MADFIDVTLPLSPRLPIYPGDPRFEAKPVKRLEAGAAYNLTALQMGTHTGTHVDAPWHFERTGATVDHLPLDRLVGRVRVVETKTHAIDGKEVAGARLDGATRVLFKTGTGARLRRGELPRHAPYLTQDGSSSLVAAGMTLVGIDTLSVEQEDSTDFPAHHTLLQAGVVIVEGLDLEDVSPGEYELLCLPLRLEGADGAPARAVLRSL